MNSTHPAYCMYEIGGRGHQPFQPAPIMAPIPHTCASACGSERRGPHIQRGLTSVADHVRACTVSRGALFFAAFVA